MSIAAGVDLHQRPLEEGENVHEPRRPEVIGSDLLWDSDWQVPRDVPLGVIDRFQDDFDRVAHLDGIAADGLHVPGAGAHRDEAPLTIQGVNDACSSQHHGGQHHGGDPDARHHPVSPSFTLAPVFAALIFAAASDALALQLALLAFMNGVAIGQAMPSGRLVMPVSPTILLPPGVPLAPIILLAPRLLIPIRMLIPIGMLIPPIILIDE
jgi:hypothetical protein